MKYNVIRNICTFLFVTFSVLSFAQNEESQDLQRTIQVYSEYKPQISDASRISVNPKVYDTLDLQVNLKYDVVIVSVDKTEEDLKVLEEIKEIVSEGKPVIEYFGEEAIAAALEEGLNSMMMKCLPFVGTWAHGVST